MKCGFVAIIGRPNAGKSTLINRLIQNKIAITSDKPQTTRTQIRGILNREDCQIVFTDTPGIMRPYHRLEERMNQESTTVMQGVDLIYLVVDGNLPFVDMDEDILQMVKQTDIPVFLILNKIDKLNREKVLKKLMAWNDKFHFTECFPISALKQEDYQELIDYTLKYLPESMPFYPTDIQSDTSQDFHISEIIREKVLLYTNQEVPHATAVKVEHKEIIDGVCVIQAIVYVEKQGQKAIMIGKNGHQLAKVINIAKKDISQFLQMPVELDLFVRVEDLWRDKDHLISQYGYGNIDE